LATADLYALSDDKRLPAALRARIAVAAWMRFDLLGREADAIAAAKRIERSAPALAADMRKYQAQAAPERRHAMLVTALKWQLTPTLNWYTATHAEFRTSPDDVTASMWCKLPASAGVTVTEDTVIEVAPPAPDTGNAAVRDKELAQLGNLKTATGYVGDHVLRRAPRLRRMIQSCRGCCTSPSNPHAAAARRTPKHCRKAPSPCCTSATAKPSGRARHPTTIDLCYRCGLAQPYAVLDEDFTRSHDLRTLQQVAQRCDRCRTCSVLPARA
jgi:hypothetical protein